MHLPHKLLTLFIGAVCWYHKSRLSGPGDYSVVYVYTMSTELPEPCVDRTSLSSNIEQWHASRPFDEGRKNKLAPPIYSGDAAYCNIRSTKTLKALCKEPKVNNKKRPAAAKGLKQGSVGAVTTGFEALGEQYEYDPATDTWIDLAVTSEAPDTSAGDPTPETPENSASPGTDHSTHGFMSLEEPSTEPTAAQEFHEVVKRQKVLLPAPVRAGPITGRSIDREVANGTGGWAQGQAPNPNNLKQRKFFESIPQIACCSKTCLKNYVGVDIAQNFRWKLLFFGCYMF